ncbi:nucleoside/nucleotide kinase family protein [Rhizobium sp. AG855]|uniref:nucleoside/nucleotide kinase family protein n=1 Tax=Rhizobium sp. AG855 TaxID=2183898 RepID=UPI000E75E241|nr:nucleoside/nucleotide kinase family protein [Rhizobium sp. AG855]RKE83394.1 pantothenate kinase [Rhizobium sp. AG855]
MAAIEDNISILAREALRLHADRGGARVLLAIAGAPGSGKSTIAEAVADCINRDRPGLAAVFPMDGYHYDDHVLDAMGRRAHKGAPDTFDAHGLRHMLLRLKENAEETIAVPVFDRQIEIARAGGRLIDRGTGIILCEGNYLLLRQPPWDRLKPIFDFAVFVDVTQAELRRRLTERWQGYGLSPEQIRFKLEENDLPNGVAIIEGSADPDLRLAN